MLLKPFKKGKNLYDFKDGINKRRLFVYSLPPKMNNTDLYDLFSKYGNVEDAYIIINRLTKQSKGFGYVIYETNEEAEKMIDRKILKFKKKKIWIKLHEKPQKGEKSRASDRNDQAGYKNRWSDQKGKQREEKEHNTKSG